MVDPFSDSFYIRCRRPDRIQGCHLEELKKEYVGRADIIFVDVWKNSALSKKYGIRAIPM
jgi:thioredoxin 1